MKTIALCAALSTACAYNFGAPRSTSRREPRVGPTVLMTGTLPGKGELLPDGRFRFTVETGKLCRRERLTVDVTRRTRKKQFSGVGWATAVGTAGLAAYGGYLVQGEHDDNIVNALGGVGMVVGLIGVTCVVVFRYAGEAGGPKQKQEGPFEQATSEGIDEVACEPAMQSQLLAGMSLSVPWGMGSMALSDGSGTVIFEPSWAAPELEARDAKVQALLHQPWTIHAGTGLSATWQPADADVTIALERVKAAAESLIDGGSPADLSGQLDVGGGALAVGEVNKLTLTVSNNGASSAVGVVVTTRSNVTALHGLKFDFGQIQPGKRATRTIEVRLPVETKDDSATMQLAFAEQHGWVPAEMEVKLKVSKSFCPGGKLTRAQYDKKRAKLKATRDEGIITAEEFDRYDAELLRCLE